MEVNKTMYGNNKCVPDKLLEMFLLSSPGIRNHMDRQVVAPDPVFPESYQTIINKQEFIIHNSVTLTFCFPTLGVAVAQNLMKGNLIFYV